MSDSMKDDLHMEQMYINAKGLRQSMFASGVLPGMKKIYRHCCWSSLVAVEEANKKIEEGLCDNFIPKYTIKVIGTCKNNEEQQL